MKKKLFWDLDDVLADFTGYVNYVHKTNYKVGDMMKYSEWEELRVNHQRMFASLKPKPTMSIAYDLGRKFDSAILTALPVDDHSPWSYAAHDKFTWVHRVCPQFPMFVGPYAHQKHRHCQPGDLLVDDKESNCIEWEAADGKAFLFRDNLKELELWLKSNV